jgi:hypothetical protein
MDVLQTKKISDKDKLTTVGSSNNVVLSDDTGNINPIAYSDFKSQLLATTQVTDAPFIVGKTASGEPVSISKADLASVVGGLTPVNGVTDGVFIMYHRKSSNTPMMVKPHKWTSLQKSGEIAEGVVVCDGGKMLVVAPTETTGYWGSNNVSGGGVTTTDRTIAYNDWAGEGNTASQIKHDELSGIDYAPGYCHQYSRTNANGVGLVSGKWWLPSLGELFMIYSNMLKINYALSLINGATQLAEAPYWSSTEGDANYAWGLYFTDGITGSYSGYGKKSAILSHIRAVSKF